jgi:NTP pyrophosphatase (non-canonical NTP hydrolase)
MNQATLQQLTELVNRFRDERDWRQFHNFKDMALSLTLEVAELCELMQWKNGPELDAHLAANRQRVGEELSDILSWVLAISSDLQIDLADAFEQKMRENARKYPVEQSKGRATKYTEL